MTTFRAAATNYLTKISPTHTPSTMRTYERNFEVVLVPYFGADTELASITTETLQSFFSADALLLKPNGQPRAEPTKDQITGLLRSFLLDAASTGMINAMPDLPARSRRNVVRLCARCQGALDATSTPPIVAPPASEAVVPPPAKEIVVAPSVTAHAKRKGSPQKAKALPKRAAGKRARK
jgi:hypothetical protein